MQSVVHLLSSCKFCCGSVEPVKMALRASRAVCAQFSTSSLWSISMTLPSSRSSQAGSMRLETTALTVSTAQTNRQTDVSWGRIQERPLVSQRFLNWLEKTTSSSVVNIPLATVHKSKENFKRSRSDVTKLAHGPLYLRCHGGPAAANWLSEQ